MTAAWHVGPIEGAEFWWLLVSSPEILVFLFFMITDPKTIPASRERASRLRRRGRSPRNTADRAADDRVRHEGGDPRRALRRVRHARRNRARRSARRADSSRRVRDASRRWSACARRRERSSTPASSSPRASPRGRTRAPARAAHGVIGALPEIVVADSARGAPIDAQRCADDRAGRPRRPPMRSRRRCGGAISTARATAASGAWLASLWERIRAAGRRSRCRRYDVDRMELSLHRGAYQGPPTRRRRPRGNRRRVDPRAGTDAALGRRSRSAFRRTLELVLDGRRYRIVRSEGGVPLGRAGSRPAAGGTLGGTTLRRRRARSRAGLPARRVPLRDVHRRDGDDGRRPLLARLRQRRLARPVRRQLVRRGGHRRLGGERAGSRGAPSTETSAAGSRT